MFSAQPYVGSEAIPTILRVNKESRYEFLPRYPILFGGVYRCHGDPIQPGLEGYHVQSERGGVRFHPEIDILSMANLWHSAEPLVKISAFSGDLARIRCIIAKLESLNFTLHDVICPQFDVEPFALSFLAQANSDLDGKSDETASSYTTTF